MAKCPYCNRELTADEMYCWHCEADVSDIKNKQEKPESSDD